VLVRQALEQSRPVAPAAPLAVPDL
jgi:hypothetical protein